MLSRRAIRSAIGGWVLNILAMPSPRNGFAIIMWLALTSSRSGGSGSARVPELELAQRRRQGHRVAGEPGAVLVGVVLAGPADRQLDHGRRERRQQRHRQEGDRVRPVLVVPAEHAEEHRELGDRGDDPGDRRGDGRGEDVPVVDVHELVPEDAAQLTLVEHLQDAPVQQTAALRGLRPVAKALGAAVGEM